ncbi:MAG TPA: hydrogenase 4 subunit B [Alphaproteobacteria bacterium]|nr:hydrogenase 4 subunit B [Alphaproteobacteria bacterium]
MLMAALAAVAVLLCLGVLAPILVSRTASPLGDALAHDLVYLGSAAACLTAGSAALAYLLAGGSAPLELTLPLGIPWMPAQLRLDALSAWFLLAINLGGLSASVYGEGYGRHVDEPRRVLPFFPAFLAGMNLVPLADDAFTFLLAWEFMSVASWLLVLANHRQPGNARAGMIYLVMAVFGGACLLLAFGILAGVNGTYHFADIRAHPPAGWVASIAVALVIIGAGSKAGAVPLHAWLPIAHPAAPSHVSALMSGVMTKVALYGLVRVLFDLMGDPGWGWGAALLAIGAASALYGILSALIEDDLKTILACSTIENVGIVLIGLGLALVFRVNGLAALAALSAGAALLHVLNHALMKTLMFCVAGAIQTATGTRSLERLGGLIHRLPVTAALALAGAAAISALPPFNGFISEWLTFQAVLGSPLLPQWTLRFGVPVVGAVMALAAALAAACFVRVYGIAFLGRPRTEEAATAEEVDPWMRGAMAGLAALCLAVGVLPRAVVVPLSQVVAGLVKAPLPSAVNGAGLEGWLWLTPLEPSQSSYSGLVVLLAAIIVAVAGAAGVHRLANNRVRRGPAWDCGFPDPQPATQYTASSFAQPLRRVFGTLVFRAVERVDMPEPPETRPARFDVRLVDPIWMVLYAPLLAMVSWVADRANPLQFLTIRRYLSLMFAALVILLSAVALSR